MNPEKNINSDYENNYYSGLELSINKDYNFKNELSHYVSVVNYTSDYAYEDMMFIKRQYGNKEEVTPDIAHEISVKPAEKMWLYHN